MTCRGCGDAWVKLATGARVPMKITKAGVMASEEKVELVVPLTIVGVMLGCEVVFKNGGCQLAHPTNGTIPVHMINGRPQISKKAAMRIIEEIEVGSSEAKRLSNQDTWSERKWIEGLVDFYPVLRDLPKHAQASLMETPGRRCSS